MNARVKKYFFSPFLREAYNNMAKILSIKEYKEEKLQKIKRLEQDMDMAMKEFIKDFAAEVDQLITQANKTGLKLEDE